MINPKKIWNQLNMILNVLMTWSIITQINKDKEHNKPNDQLQGHFYIGKFPLFLVSDFIHMLV